jgi:hypothetical protein
LRVTRYIRQHHIGLVALFIALTGTAYAGTQVASHPSKTQTLKAKKKKAKPGPAGPAGPQGPKGDSGAAGTARAYALVQDGQLDATRSIGILGMSQGCTGGGTCDPPAPGTGDIHTYCFKLAFTPNNVQITPLGVGASSSGGTQVVNFDGHAPALSSAASVGHCPTGFLSAQVDASGNTFASIPHGFYVAFN